MEYKPSFMDDLNSDYISHHGIKGQKWGVRRFQNQNGSLTPAGIIRYHRNKHLINKKIKSNNEALDNNRKMVKNEEEALKRMTGQKEKTIKMLKEMGYDDSLSTNTVDAFLNEQQRYIQFGKELIKNVELENKKLSEIDFNAKSYKETKKMVDDMITEHAFESLESINSYYTSKEYNTYLNYGGKPRSVGVTAV